MRLLFDQNLSRALVRRLADLFPDSSHVTDAGLDRATDAAVWTWARDRGLTLITRDRDFESTSQFPGPPPKCVLLIVGNASTDDIEHLVRQAAVEVDAFEHDSRRLLTLS